MPTYSYAWIERRGGGYGSRHSLKLMYVVKLPKINLGPHSPPQANTFLLIPSSNLKMTRYLENHCILYNFCSYCIIAHQMLCRSWHYGIVLAPIKREITKYLENCWDLTIDHLTIFILVLVYYYVSTGIKYMAPKRYF